MSNEVIVPGRYVDHTFIPEGPLPDTEGQAELRIRPRRGPRAGWAEAARELAEASEDVLLDGGGPLTKFDEEHWEW